MSITLDGSNLTTNGVINSATAQNTTSGTVIDFTGIPAGVKRVTVMFNGVSTSGTNLLLIQVGSGSPQSTGYVSTTTNLQNGAAASVNTSTSGFAIYQNNASEAGYGAFILCNVGSNAWVCSGSVSITSGATVHISTSGGVTLSGVLDRVRITTVGGTDTFDAGTINILYE